MSRKNQAASLIGQALVAVITLVIQFLFVVFVIAIPKLIYVIWAGWGYKKSDYYAITHKSYLSVLFNKGAFGEYLIYRYLKKSEVEQKWLFNIYLPREEGRTTEADVMLIRPEGIYVFESKNYAGWIFGSERHRTWTQCLKSEEYYRAKKIHFLNPIMQNQLHIKWLQEQLKDCYPNVPIYSMIVFGNRCKLKKIKYTPNQKRIMHVRELKQYFTELEATNSQSGWTIGAVYHLLYPYTQVSDEVKEAHVAAIQSELSVAVQQDEELFVSDEGDRMVDEFQNDGQATSVVQPNEEKYCPWCGSKLVLRIAQNGSNAGRQFYGCSRYPKCKYVLNQVNNNT